ncbi:MAG: methylated-DNA--[protein]-cysteine S-methyltransferase [Steroidobacteraceae bacterium]
MCETPRESSARLALEAYFEGNLAAIDRLPTAIHGTAFQCQVWDALRSIPFGQTISYATLAARIGRPSAARTVGLANGANPIAIVVPCHRVMAAHGALTGYGGGLARKQWLLAHEGANVPSRS